VISYRVATIRGFGFGLHAAGAALACAILLGGLAGCKPQAKPSATGTPSASPVAHQDQEQHAAASSERGGPKDSQGSDPDPSVPAQHREDGEAARAEGVAQSPNPTSVEGTQAADAGPARTGRTDAVVTRAELEPVVQYQLAKLEAVVEETPDSADDWGTLAMRYHAYGLTDAAQDAYARAAQLAPDAFAWAYLPGHIAFGAGDFAAAEAQFARAAALRPDYPAAQVWRSRALLELGKAKEVRKLLRDLADTGPSESVVLWTLGQAYLELGEPVSAVQVLKPLVDAHPQWGQVRRDLVRAFAALGQPERAAKIGAAWPANNLGPTLRDPELVAIYRDTVGTDAEVRRALAYVAAGDLTRAVAHYDLALEHAPRNAEILASRADLLLRMGAVEPAEKDLDAALAIQSDHPLALMRKGQLHLLRGEREAAGALIEKARATWPNNSTLLAMAARVAELGDDHAEASRLLAQAAEYDPGNAELQFELGLARWRGADRHGATEAFQAAVRIDPQFTPALKALGDAYFEMGSADAADTWYSRAYDAGATEPVVCFRASVRAMQQQDFDRCEAALKRGLKVAPDDTQLLDALARFYAICPYAVYRNGEEALRLARRAYGENESEMSARGLQTMASVYAELGDFERAVALIDRVLEQMRGVADPVAVERMETFRALYAQGKHIYDVGS
jgi:tetratricopeptide (TPR) repeat protein